jgi:hypothetical protein
MKDRVPGAPGQYKAVISEAELQKMNAGEQFAITMTRDDQPIVEGTPYSKAAVLPDDVAEQICPNIEDPTPADVFLALQKNKAPAIKDTNYTGCYYRMVDGNKEWINPPMVIGVEYRTTERYNGKVVYKKAIRYGHVAQGGDFSWEHGISDIDDCVSVEVLNETFGNFTAKLQTEFTRTHININIPWSNGVGSAQFYLAYTKTTNTVG